MKSNVYGILALIIGVSTFSFNYFIALETYPETPLWAVRMLYYGCFISLGLAFLQLTYKTDNKTKQLIYYGGFNFYVFLTLAYILNQLLDVLISQNKIIFTIISTTASCIIYYLFSIRSR